MQVSLLEAAANLTNLVEAAINGEEVILLNASDRPVAHIMSVKNVSTKAGNFDQSPRISPNLCCAWAGRALNCLDAGFVNSI